MGTMNAHRWHRGRQPLKLTGNALDVEMSDHRSHFERIVNQNAPLGGDVLGERSAPKTSGFDTPCCQNYQVLKRVLAGAFHIFFRA